MKKYLSVLLVMAMLFAMTMFPVSADGLSIGELDTGTPINGLTNFNVRLLVGRYFAQREAYLRGDSATIDVAVAPMLNDEAAHKEALADANAVLTASTITVDSIWVGDYVAEVVVTEIAVFLVGNAAQQETVVHQIIISQDYEGNLFVCSDGYKEVTTEFVSASYVGLSASYAINSTNTGSAPCIVSVAVNELSYVEREDGYNKYGDWYDWVYGTDCFAWSDWCATFVSWCANEANVPTSVIPCIGAAPTMAETFEIWERYYDSAAYGGTYTPQPSDIAFMGSSTAITHVGIVSNVWNGEVYIISGNSHDESVSDGRYAVDDDIYSLTNTFVVGYAHPNYGSNTHTGDDWEYDYYEHWKICTSCNFEVRDNHHMEQLDGGQIGCLTCGYIEGDIE